MIQDISSWSRGPCRQSTTLIEQEILTCVSATFCYPSLRPALPVRPVASDLNLRQLEYPSWSRLRRGPSAIVADESICKYDEISHDGGDGDLGTLADFAEGFVFGL